MDARHGNPSSDRQEQREDEQDRRVERMAKLNMRRSGNPSVRTNSRSRLVVNVEVRHWLHRQRAMLRRSAEGDTAPSEARMEPCANGWYRREEAPCNEGANEVSAA